MRPRCGRLPRQGALLILLLCVAVSCGAREDSRVEAPASVSEAPTPGVPTPGVPTTGAPTPGVPTTGAPTTRSPTTGEPVAAAVQPAMQRPVERLVIEVVASAPHDREAFTQGLVWSDGWLYESIGRYGLSELRQVDRRSGRVFRRTAVPPDLFAEGLERVGDRLIQLTWKAGRALVYRLEDLTLVAELSYGGEGWGLCFDGTRLVMSDGSERLQFRDPETMQPLGGIDVTHEGRPVRGLNELECVEDKVYANLWPRSGIVRIDPASGRIEALIDPRGLLTAEEAVGIDVLNGIAYDAQSSTFLITGKLWPKLFEVRFVPDSP